MTADPAAAESHSRPLGSEGNTRGVISKKEKVDLNMKPFEYGKAEHGHSAQFLGTNMLRKNYWKKLLTTFDLTEEREE